MEIKRILSALVLALVIVIGLSMAKPGFVPATVGKSAHNTTVMIPKHAVEVSPGVFFLGTAVVKGKLVEGYAIVDYKPGYGKPTGCKDDGVCQGWEDPSCIDCEQGGEEQKTTCYGFLAKGAKWKTLENYVINPSNTEGISDSYVTSNFASDISKWENAAGKNIIGSGTNTSEVLFADTSSPDGRNEVYFGEISDTNAIAITIVWGYFRGPPGQRELLEWDMVFDQNDFDWSSSGEAGKMDFENIATHELGHSVGLDDLYETKCSEQTMYGYAAYGETKKRTLETGDIAGVKELYK